MPSDRPIAYNAGAMSIFAEKLPWYCGGLAFECRQCGRCCAGPEEGYVWIDRGEIKALARFLKMRVTGLRDRYLRRVSRRYSLVEDPRTKDCVFLAYDTQGRSRCTIYPVRPRQCRTWPFWPSNLSSFDRWCEAGLRCPGINQGPLHDCDEIRRKREETSGV